MPEEGESSSSDPRLDVLKACAVLHLHVRYVIEPADLKNASQTKHVESLQAIYIGFEQGPRFPHSTREDTRLTEAKLGDEAEISLYPHSTELIHGRRRERYTAHYLGHGPRAHQVFLLPL